jgi:hypothetical protein
MGMGAAKPNEPPAPCHPNPAAAVDTPAVAARRDVVNLPARSKDRLVQPADPARLSADGGFRRSRWRQPIVQYYLLDSTGFDANVFTTTPKGVNDQVQLTGDGGRLRPSQGVGAVRVVLEPKPGLPTDRADPRAFIDVVTDTDLLFVINNESGWYEGRMIHDVTVTASP